MGLPEIGAKITHFSCHLSLAKEPRRKFGYASKSSLNNVIYFTNPFLFFDSCTVAA
jgi:hypothetical protein